MYQGDRAGVKKTTGSKVNSPKKVKSKPKGTSETLLEIESSPMMSKPVVVPTTMEKSMYKKVNPKKKIDVDLEELNDDDDIYDVEEIIEEKPKRRGRPRKNPLPEEPKQELDKPKKRGRPRKNPLPEPEPIEEEGNVLPGFEDEEDEEEAMMTTTIHRSNVNIDSNTILPGFEEDDEEEDQDEIEDDYEYDVGYVQNNKEIQSYDNVFEDGEFESLLTGDKKVVTFVGTSKNGTSFIVNNIAQILSSMGVNTAILDATQNKNAYYIYTKNDEDLRKTAVNSIDNLINERAMGIRVNNNLTVYTTIPSRSEKINHSRPIMETLVRNHTIILIDCDFKTPTEYFEKSQEIYLVQSMDVLTIQPLTEFLRELKIKNILDENKIRIVLNKLLKVRGVSGKNIIGGMSNYNDPEMSFMTELFNRNTVKVSAQIPFDEDVYAKYLENLIECEIKLNGYPKEFKVRLNNLAESIFPLLPNKNNNKRAKKEGYNQYSSSFSSDMNHTLNNMRKKY